MEEVSGPPALEIKLAAKYTVWRNWNLSLNQSPLVLSLGFHSYHETQLLWCSFADEYVETFTEQASGSGEYLGHVGFNP